MRDYCCISFLFAFAVNSLWPVQSQDYVVEIAQFSTRTEDEFSPVYYKNGIVFCSNRSDNSIISYNDKGTRIFKIFYAERKSSSGWKQPKLFAGEITTDFNDGPVTFNEEGNLIYYSRNNSVNSSLRNISDTSNKLGIFSAELREGKWTNITPFIYNNPRYNFTTPALSPDGERIYFSSDMPGGRGGMDLYYCVRHNNQWIRR